MRERWIDRGEWHPVEVWKENTFLAVMAAVDLSIIALAVWYFHSKGWI